MRFLENLNFLLKKRNISRNELARSVSIAPSTIAAWYKTGYDNVSLKTLCKLSDFFNVSIDELVKKDLSKLERNDAKMDLKTIQEFARVIEKLDAKGYFIKPDEYKYIGGGQYDYAIQCKKCKNDIIVLEQEGKSRNK